MQFIDLKAQQARIREDVEARLKAVLDHGRYVMGPEIDEIEESLANFSGTACGMGCASGTDALLLALMAKGIGPGDAILTTPFTFIATAEVVSLLNATPVFVDIDPKTFNMDPEALEKTILAMESGDGSVPLPRMDSLPKPRGIIAVDLFGQVADYARIEAIAQKHGLFVIEDGAQSFGGLQSGRRACSFGEVACTSFFPAKPLGCYGDGGMCFTDDQELDGLMRSLRMHGQGGEKYDNVRIGVNGRIDSIQSAVLLSKFSIFPEELDLRQKAAERYNALLADSDKVVTPYVGAGKSKRVGPIHPQGGKAGMAGSTFKTPAIPGRSHGRVLPQTPAPAGRLCGTGLRSGGLSRERRLRRQGVLPAHASLSHRGGPGSRGQGCFIL